MQKQLRQPIVCVLGHVDSGKTSILDNIRSSAVALREVGSMTQHIGASFFPLKLLKKICGPLSKSLGAKIAITGLLVIDTPGHRIFMNLRRRGGSVADIAILVIDVIRGFEAQTYESLSILKNRKTPFIVAANKIDTIPGWVKHSNLSFLESYNKQDLSVQRRLNDLLYVIMGQFSRQGFQANRFDKVVDFTKTITIIPLSAKTGEGIPELLVTLIGLTQQYMKNKLIISTGPAHGTVLEVKEDVGMGVVINVILYQGILRRGDVIVIGGRNQPIVTKVKAILLPNPLDEIRDPREKFKSVEEVSAAVGIKIAAPAVDNTLAGAPLYTVGPDTSIEELIQKVTDEVEKLRVMTDKVGVILKTDTLGSLEAIVAELENSGIPLKIADVGDVSRREVIEASLIRKTAPLRGVILAFNVKILPDALEEAKKNEITLFQNNVIYRLIDDYKEWVNKEREAMTTMQLKALVHPGKIQILPNCIFRKSNPAIFGVEVLSGRIEPKYSMIKIDGKTIGEIMQIQDGGETISQANKRMKVAVSMREAIFNRHFNEGDILYVAVPEEHVKEFVTKYKGELSFDEIQTLEELIDIMRKKKPMWGL
jgi:translation initiation factor 5B